MRMTLPTIQQHKRSPEIVQIEYLYLDDTTCSRCQDTGGVLEKVLKVIEPAIQIAGFTLEVRKIEIESESLAIKYRFLSSPTIRVNGIDIFGDIVEDNCACCSDISGSVVDCRVFEVDGLTRESPDEQMLAGALLRALFAPKRPTEVAPYAMPENLHRFFRGKAALKR